VLNKGSLKQGWQGYKYCQRCEGKYWATSGSRKYCDICIEELSICPECKEEKSLYDKFCSNSCAGKWKYKNSEKVRNALLYGVYHPNRRKGISKALTGKPRFDLRNEKNPNWKGGNYKCERHTDMGRVEYINWRRLVFIRDSFTCQYCLQQGGKLNVHHIKSWKEYPELRYEVENGITICVFCHREIHKSRR
jgi:hypothetical protein